MVNNKKRNKMTEEKPKPKETKVKESKDIKKTDKKIAVILIRGLVGSKTSVKDTCKMLNIMRKHVCVVYPATPSILGMIKKIKDYITYGVIDDETYKLLVEKRGKMTKDKEGKEVLKPFFRLAPPKGGFERKGIKTQFSVGGALGERKEKINDLIKKML